MKKKFLVVYGATVTGVIAAVATFFSLLKVNGCSVGATFFGIMVGIVAFMCFDAFFAE